MSYEFNGFYIRDQMMGAIERYIEHGMEPGSFLTAVICNDLFGACGRADAENLRNIPAFVAYFYNEVPSSCFGSPERMKAWMDARSRERSK